MNGLITLRGAGGSVRPGQPAGTLGGADSDAGNIKNNLPHYLQLRYCHTPHFFTKKRKLVLY